MSADQHVIELDVRLDPEEVLRLMGGVHSAPVRHTLTRMVERHIEELRQKIQARGVYAIREVDSKSADRLELRGCPPFEGQIAAFMEPARRVAVFVVTIGGEIEVIAERRMEQGATLEGFAIDAIGSAAADAAADALADHVLWNDAGPDEAVTPPFSPGYCGMPLEQQQLLFTIVDPRPIGVQLLPAMIMRPIKSVSGLVGIGDQESIATHGVPCEFCKMTTCRMRR
jgi:cobalamin-dependent methionine synthase I